MLTARQAFQFGFLLKCAEDGLSPAQIEERLDAALEKQAFGETIGKAVDLAAGMGGLGLAAGGLGGAGLGYMLGSATEPTVDADEIKKRELISVLQQYTERAKRHAAPITYRQPQPTLRRPELFPA